MFYDKHFHQNAAQRNKQCYIASKSYPPLPSTMPSRRFVPLLLAVVIASVTTQFNSSKAIPLVNFSHHHFYNRDNVNLSSTKSDNRSSHYVFDYALAPCSSSFQTDSSRVTGVWPVTRVVSLFGPTIAIFIYEKARDVYERYEPIVNAAVLDFVQALHHAVQSPYTTRSTFWLSSMPQSHTNPQVTHIANEIIRLTNVRLRENAVISRIQMDDDQYELSRDMSASDVRKTALKVMHNVLHIGSGKYLSPEDKSAVHALIASSIY